MADDAKRSAALNTEVRNTAADEAGNPRFVCLPPSESVVAKATPLLRSRSSRIPEAVATLLEDPVTTLEIFRRATDPSLGQSRSYLATIQGAVVRLGSARVVQALDELKARPLPEDQNVRKKLELLRDFSTRTSIIARLLAFHANAGSPDEAQAGGLMTQIGLMVACYHFGTRYLELAESPSRASLIYHLEKRYGFHVDQFLALYLASYGLPSGLLIALDPTEPCKTSRQAALRFVVQASVELVDAYDTDKWKKYAFLGNVPSRSTYRLLQIPEKHHEIFYEEATDYLSGKTAKDASAAAPPADGSSVTEPGTEPLLTEALNGQDSVH